MPIYEYVAEEPEDPDRSCGVCRRGFDLRRPSSRPDLEVCFLCKGPVRKRVSRVHSPRVAGPLSISEAKSAGFTVMQRRDEGVYEKL